MTKLMAVFCNFAMAPKKLEIKLKF